MKSNNVKISAFVVLVSSVILGYYFTYLVKFAPNFNIKYEVEKHGYKLEEHNVTTKDGYILVHHRIIPNVTNGRVAVLVHGTYAKSATWLCLGPKKSLGYNLANEGYDVWLLNLRGNGVSSQHLNNSNPNYWDFSWHEIGIYDIPATIDYILKITNVSSVNYVGHSLGATVYFVMASEVPKYTRKIEKVVSLSPASFGADLANSYPRIYSFIHFALMTMNRTRLYPPMFPGYDCKNGLDIICTLLMSLRFENYDNSMKQANEFDLIMHLSMAPGSWPVLIHFYQNFMNNKFQMFDHGIELNELKYGEKVPPEYDLSKTINPIAIFFSDYDRTCHSKITNDKGAC